MVELLGILLALLLFALGALVWRVLRWLRRALALLLGRSGAGRRVASLRGVRLRVARALGQHQAARIAALTTELERTRRALRLAEAARGGGGPPEDRFRRAKRAFAVHFHPDRLRCGEPERGLRIRIFQQFWQVLRRIESS
ncbi:hypothetical protein [Roseicella aquatilis]|uniref:J domain-containing protein n=1 Tax=Roseicella aquatilis TaxID=2527868 RepID=A0A4R4DQZ3_9PROT|nr:hypothetical protein [Roseicella aquatilis]TCZ63638.1 hypothetical protein EXY23_09645 [Roseicella aquatilis]